MIEVKVEQTNGARITLADVYPGDVFFLESLPGEAVLMTTSEKGTEKIAVVLETGESLFLSPRTKVSRLAIEARLYVKD